MKAIVLIYCLGLFGQATAQSSPDCKCVEYPFTPDPPCAKVCYRKLAIEGNTDFKKIKNLDPGVALSLRVLASRPDKALLDFSKVNSKADLETLALQSVESGRVMIYRGP